MAAEIGADALKRSSLGERLGSLTRDSALYAGANAVRSVLGLVTFPLLARHFSVSDYGLIDLLTVITSLLCALFLFGQDSASLRLFYAHDDEASRRQVISQSVLLQTAFMLVAAPVVWVGGAAWVGSWSDSPQTTVLLKLVLLQAVCQLYMDYSATILRITFRRSGFVCVTVGPAVARVLVIVVGIVGFDIGIVALFELGLAVNLIFALVGLGSIRHWLTQPRTPGDARALLNYAVPIGVVCVVGIMVPAAERWLVLEIVGTEALGFYAAGTKVALILGMGIAAFQNAWWPFALAIHKEADAFDTYNWVLKAFVGVMVPATVLLVASGGALLALLASDRYSDGSVVVLPLTLAVLVKGLSGFWGLGINLSNRTSLKLLSCMVFLAASILAAVMLGRVFGISGIAWGIVVGAVAGLALDAWLSSRVHPLPWPYGRVAVLLIATALLGAYWTFPAEPAHWADILVRCAVSALIVGVLAWKVLLNAQERDKVQLRMQANR